MIPVIRNGYGLAEEPPSGLNLLVHFLVEALGPACLGRAEGDEDFVGDLSRGDSGQGFVHLGFVDGTICFGADMTFSFGFGDGHIEVLGKGAFCGKLEFPAEVVLAVARDGGAVDSKMGVFSGSEEATTLLGTSM